MVFIQHGTARANVHEHGCPNRSKRYDHFEERWRTVYHCGECDSAHFDMDDARQCCNEDSAVCEGYSGPEWTEDEYDTATNYGAL